MRVLRLILFLVFSSLLQSFFIISCFLFISFVFIVTILTCFDSIAVVKNTLFIIGLLVSVVLDWDSMGRGFGKLGYSFGT